MKNKNYIYNNGKIKKCPANILKMNPFEWCYYSIFHWNYFERKLSEIWDLLKEILIDILSIFGILITTLFMPISAYYILKEDRKYWGKKD